MHPRDNAISQRVALESKETLIRMYKEIVDWKQSGILADPSALRNFSGCLADMLHIDVGTALKVTETAVLEELGRRFVNLFDEESYETLANGDDIFYIDEEYGQIEHGIVDGVYRKDGVVDTFSATFDNGDFDSFDGSGLGVHYFRTADAARAHFTAL